MNSITEYAVEWNADWNFASITFFDSSKSANLRTEQIAARDVMLIVDLIQTQGMGEFFSRFGGLVNHNELVN
jgi:hypothetical protein